MDVDELAEMSGAIRFWKGGRDMTGAGGQRICASGSGALSARRNCLCILGHRAGRNRKKVLAKLK